MRTTFARLRRVASGLGGYLGLAVVVAVVLVLLALGVLPARRWEAFADIRVWEFLANGLAVTVQIAVVALVASSILSIPLALARLSLPGPLRLVAIAWIELIRATPVLALILATTLFLPRTGVAIAPVWAATLGLTMYTSAVLAETVRAGILSIPAGEVAAARSLGLSYLETMRLVVLPQALARMMPSLVSQSITLVKDTSLASIAAVSELVGYARSSFVFFGNPAETLFVVACLFFVINYTLSRIARRLELRQPSQERVAIPVAIEQETVR